ncbi:MAG: hypothetical protein ACOWWO_20170 [Peptococcaceae bacterium]
MGKRKNNILFLVILFILTVGIFYRTGPGIKELIIFTVLSVLMMIAIYLTSRYYMTDNSCLKQRVIFFCMTFVIITIFCVAVQELAGFSVNYTLIVFFMAALVIQILWVNLHLTPLEKGVLVLTLLSFLGATIYQSIAAKHSTAIDLYRSQLREAANFESFQKLLLEDYRDNFTREDFRDLKPYLQQVPLRYNQPVFFEFEDGRMVMIEAGISQELNNPLRIKNIEVLPEKIASYFRHYPLEIERKADFLQGMKEDQSIIETRGAFLSRASSSQQRGWYEQLISVFGKKEVWDEL